MTPPLCAVAHPESHQGCAFSSPRTSNRSARLALSSRTFQTLPGHCRPSSALPDPPVCTKQAGWALEAHVRPHTRCPALSPLALPWEVSQSPLPLSYSLPRCLLTGIPFPASGGASLCCTLAQMSAPSGGFPLHLHSLTWLRFAFTKLSRTCACTVWFHYFTLFSLSHFLHKLQVLVSEGVTSTAGEHPDSSKDAGDTADVCRKNKSLLPSPGHLCGGASGARPLQPGAPALPSHSTKARSTHPDVSAASSAFNFFKNTLCPKIF